MTCGFALRNLVDLGRFFDELGPGACAPAAASPCSRSPPRPTRCCGPATRVYFGSVVPLVGGLLSNPAAYRYLPRSVAYLPPPDEMLAPPGGRRVHRRRSPAAVGWHRPARDGHPRMRAVTRRLERPDRPRGVRRRRRLPVRARRRRPGRPGRRRAGGPSPTSAPSWPPSRPTTRWTAPAADRSPSARCRSCRARRRELVVPAVVVRRDADGVGLGDPHRRRRDRPDPGARAPAAGRRLHAAARVRPRRLPGRGVPGPRPRARRAADQGGAGPRRRRSRPSTPSTCTPC